MAVEMDTLPINRYRKEIIKYAREHRALIVVGETGSGKSTQLPQFLADSFTKGRIVCTQPRRVACIAVATRVASERRGTLGKEVGYSIRFEDKTSANTRIKFVTDGVLLRECMSDPLLSSYEVVILDESHERSLQTDILMGLLRMIQEQRPTLRIVVMSATLQIDTFMAFFKDTCLLTIEGRQHPVDVLYACDAVVDYVDAAKQTCLQIYAEEEAGGVLVFLPGQDDIEALQLLLEESLPIIEQHLKGDEKKNGGSHTSNLLNLNKTKSPLKGFEIFPLYAAMGAEEQMRAFSPAVSGVRKFILATNIAETSVTVAGIKYVVDSGFLKSRLIQASTGVDMLKIVPVSKAQANQRAGRSGRESAGKCFRLYTESAFENLEEASSPEIERVNIAQVVLQLKEHGVKNIHEFPFLTPPSNTALRTSLLCLLQLQALDKNQALTDQGRKMAKLPLEPHFAYLLLQAGKLGCVVEILTIVAMLSTENVLLVPARDEEKREAGKMHRIFYSRDGDLVFLLNIFDSWCKAGRDKIWSSRHYLSHRGLLHAASVRLQLDALLKQLGMDTTLSCGVLVDQREPLLRCIAAGLFLNTARRLTNVDEISRPLRVRGELSFFDRLNERKKNDGEATGAPYKTLITGQSVHIHPSSVLFGLSGGNRKLPAFIVFSEILITSKQYVRGVTAVEASWLSDLHPSLFQKRQATNAIAAATTVQQRYRDEGSNKKAKFESARPVSGMVSISIGGGG